MRLRNSVVNAHTQPTVHVLATGVDGTRGALATAIPLARGSRARVAVMVPQVVPYPLAVVAMLLILGAPRSARAQSSPRGERPDQSTRPAEASRPVWQYGGFVDFGYLRDFNDPSNHLFRGRGTAFHVNVWDLNMAAAYAK
jgi:hypothetical protein